MARQDDYVRYTIRVPEELYAQIKAAAGEKSVNAEIILRLESAMAVDMPRETLNWLEAEAEKGNRTTGEELLYRLELTRRFDLDVGEWGRTRSEAGPIADYIDRELGALQRDIFDIKELLVEVLEKRNAASAPTLQPHGPQPDSEQAVAVRAALQNRVEVTDTAPPAREPKKGDDS